MIAHQPIGLFDSGIGGLTIAKAVVEKLPNEHLIYFGDTAHLPYGDKSPATIQSYAVKITEMLLAQHCKLILIACNSASAAAYPLLQERFGDRVILMNVIDPLVIHLREYYAQKRIGLIATRQTVSSNVYQQKIDQLNCGIQLTSLATNLLAGAIEEFGDHAVIEPLLQEYLAHPSLQHLDALVLACTHYPVIKHKIEHFFKHAIQVIDPSEQIAWAVKDRLIKHHYLNPSEQPGTRQFFVSDYTDSFAIGTQRFFQEPIQLKHYPLD